MNSPQPGQSQLILSVFPGIDLFGRGFEEAGFCVVRGPDILWGGDIRQFFPPAGRFDGVIGGSPCQEGLELLEHFGRVVWQAAPEWFLLENVPSVPTIEVEGYRVQRLDLDARECGLPQRRLRHFQFGSRSGKVIIPQRLLPMMFNGENPTCLASEGTRKHRRTFEDFCKLQGLSGAIDLPGMTKAARYRAVGNAVALPVARVLADAVKSAVPWHTKRLCACGCGRELRCGQIEATDACRKRMQRRRDTAALANRRAVTPELISV